MCTNENRRCRAVVSLVVLCLLFATASFDVQAASTLKAELLGQTVSDNEAGRLVHILPTTRYVNVTGGEIIRFEINGKYFSWSFDGPLDVNSFPLSLIMPAGMIDHEIKIYIAPNPDYSGQS